MKIDKLTRCMSDYIADLHDMIDDFAAENEQLENRLHTAVEQANTSSEILWEIHDLIVDNILTYIVPDPEGGGYVEKTGYILNIDSDENVGVFNKLMVLCGITEEELDS